MPDRRSLLHLSDSHACTACGGPRDLEIANMCGNCLKTGVHIPESGAAQVQISKALEAIQNIKPASLTLRELDLFRLYNRQISEAIDRAGGRA